MIAFGAALTGCAEEIVDINDEITLGRCMTPTELSAKIIDGEFIEFSWTKSKGATEFVLELYSDEEMTALVQSYTILADQLPYKVDLEADMTYYARVKAVNGEGVIADSEWAVYDRALETYAVKSSLNPELVDRSETSITIKWTKDPEVDHVRITPALNADEDYTRFDLTKEDVEVGQAEVTGLNPSVNYTLGVYFKSADRGQVIAWTRPSIEGATEVATAEALKQAIADGAAVIKVAYSETPYHIESVALTKSVKLYGDGTPEGAQPVIQGGLKIGADVTSIHCEALTFDGMSLADYPHHLTFDAAATLESITVLNCNLNNYLRGMLYENSKAPKVTSISYEGVAVNNVGGDGGDCFDFRGEAVVGDISFENCTFNVGGRTYFRLDAKTKLESISLTHCTFNNLCFANNGNNNGIFNIRALNAAGAAPKFVLTHNVFLNMNDANKRCCLVAKNSTSAFPTELSDNFYYNCYDRFFIPQKDGSALAGDELKKAAEEGRARILVGDSFELDSDPCVDSGRDKFNVINKEVIAANAGDPRWYATYVEIPEDLTQEVTPTGKVWDLTDALTFKKLADKDMVRDGIRFYVKNTPINFGKTGFEFTAEASFDKEGLPVDGAIGIKVNQPGSVVLSVAEALGHSSLTVSLDGKVSASVPAGAEYQKVTFANISEEKMIYIYGCHPATLTFLQWTSDVQVLDKVLATPVVSIDKTVVDERAEGNITLTWEPVDFAASYNVTIDGKVNNVTETTYSFATAGYSVEEEGGDFKIEVTAVPAEDDYIRQESSAAELSFHVNDVPVEDTGGIPSDPTAIEVFEELSLSTMTTTTIVKGTSHQEGKFTLVALADKDMVVEPGKPRAKIGGSSKVGDDGIPTGGYISFKITTPGTITHKVISSSSSETTRKAKVALVKNGIATIIYNENAPVSSGAEAVTTEITQEMLAGVTTTCTVYVYGDEGAVNIHELSFDPKPVAVGIPSDPTAIEVEEELSLSTMTTTTIVKGTSHQEGKFTLVALADKDMVVEPGKPRAKIGGSSKVGDDGIPTGGYISFKITTPGTITHKVISSSSSETTRKAKVALVKNGTATIIYNENAPVSSGAEAVTTEITQEMLAGVTTTCTVYVYGDEGAVNIHALKYSPSK